MFEVARGSTAPQTVTVTYVQALEDDFFNEVDAISRGDFSHAAKLRFTHAEVIVPFASLLGLEGMFAPVPEADTCGDDTNSWRGEFVSPMAANVQWDVVRDASGTLLVKMLYCERETGFKAACDSARHAAGSHFYSYEKLKACYGHSAL